MEEPKKNHDSKDMPCGEHCLHGFGHQHYVLRLILGIIILVAVYSLGVQVGEFRGSLRSEYGYGRHGMMWGNEYGGAYPTMMGRWINTNTTQPAAETPAKK